MISSVAASSQYISLAAGAERRGYLPLAGRVPGPACGCLCGEVGEAGEILANLVRETGGVGPAVGDLSVLADLQRVGAGGGEDEGPDRLAVVNTVMAAEVPGNLDDVQPVVSGQGAVQGTGEGLAGQGRPAGQVPFLVEVQRGVTAEQNAVIKGDGGRRAIGHLAIAQLNSGRGRKRGCGARRARRQRARRRVFGVGAPSRSTCARAPAPEGGR